LPVGSVPHIELTNAGRRERSGCRRPPLAEMQRRQQQAQAVPAARQRPTLSPAETPREPFAKGYQLDSLRHHEEGQRSINRRVDPSLRQPRDKEQRQAREGRHPSDNEGDDNPVADNLDNLDVPLVCLAPLR
jgi:hypothetical protein